MADKIAEILNYGSLQKVKEVCSDEKTTVLELFNRSKYELYKKQNLLLDEIDFYWNVIPTSMLQYGALVHQRQNNGTVKVCEVQTI